MATSSSTIHHHSPIFKLTHSPDSTHSNTIKPLTIHCKKKTGANSPFEPKKSVFVDYDRGEHDVSTRVSGLRKSDIPRRHRLVVEGNRFQKDWTVSEVVEKVLELKRFEDVEGVLNQWVGRFARKNFPFLIKELTQRGAIEHSNQVFNWMKNQKNYCARNDIYNMMIRLHARHNQTDRARGLFFEMQKWRCKPDAETYNALINAHGRAGQWRWAMNIIDDMLRAAIPPSRSTYNNLINACGSSGNWREALKVCKKMTENGVGPDLVTHNIVLSAYKSGAQYSKALSYFELMTGTNIRPDTTTHNIVIYCLIKLGQYEKAIDLFNSMREKRAECDPDIVTFTSIIHLYSVSGQIENCKAVFNTMLAEGLKPKKKKKLVRTVIQSLLMHNFKVYLWPRSLLSLIQTWARNFIQSGSAHQRKMALVSWENFCLPRLEGGLGLRRLDTLNASCLLKSLWDIHTGCSVNDIYLQSRYFKVGNKRNYSCSSLWSGFNSVLNHFSKGSSWLIGDGTRINLWHDSWLDKAILPCSGRQVFATKLSSVIKNGKWQFPILFFKAFPHLKESIMNLTLPIISGPDRLVWKSSRDGTLMLKDCYNYLRTRRDTQPWLSPLWKHFVPPRFAILTWKALQGRLPVDDILQTRGIYMVSSCSFCLSYLESNDHLFATCSFTKSLWLWTSSKFCINFPSCSTVSALWGWIIEKNFSPQLRNLWFTTACFVFHSIWRARNRLRYDNVKPSLRYIHTDILTHIRYFASFCPGYVHYGSDHDTLAELKIPWKLTKAPKSLILVWHAPPIGWIKVNTDGMAKGNPGSSACGGVFRDCDGAFLGGYGLAFGHQTAYYSEIMGVILAIELAFARGWGKLWLESDSLSTIHLLMSDSLLPPWNLQNR